MAVRYLHLGKDNEQHPLMYPAKIHFQSPILHRLGFPVPVRQSIDRQASCFYNLLQHFAYHPVSIVLAGNALNHKNTESCKAQEIHDQTHLGGRTFLAFPYPERTNLQREHIVHHKRVCYSISQFFPFSNAVSNKTAHLFKCPRRIPICSKRCICALL